MTTLVGLKKGRLKNLVRFLKTFFMGKNPVVRDFKLMGNNDHFLFYHEAV